MKRADIPLERPTPPDPDPVVFDPVDDEMPAVTERSYEAKLEIFEDSIDRLRDQYESFRRNLTPDREVTRERSTLRSFSFRYETDADERDFDRVIAGDGEWESVTVPDFRGPVGSWTGFYRTTFDDLAGDGDRRVLRFSAADYVARVYLNGRCLGEHEGMFAPFEFDVTGSLRETGNVLVVEIENDETMLGSRTEETGEKICAANGPGWDEPGQGWHTCPPGAGIHGEVRLEARSECFIQDCYAETDGGSITANVEVTNGGEHSQPFALRCAVFPRNFDGESGSTREDDFEPAGPGPNRYSTTIDLDEYRRWSPDEPWLYQLRVTLLRDGTPVDQQTAQFGIRDFGMTDRTGRKGNFELNGEPIYLRGTNEMGNLQRSAMDGDEEQLLEDLLILKNANCNYLRFTQRPVPKRISEACDRLGVMTQSDLPLFAQLRFQCVPEALKQVDEMARLVRGHPSSVVLSYMNEPQPLEELDRAHRFLLREEAERFFDAATDMIELAGSEVVVKNVDGDLNPPTGRGITDFHTYTMWYTNQELSIGEFHRGYLPEVKAGWQVGCGEYGAEGLDNVSTMETYYPEEWLPEEGEPWTPAEIPYAQTARHHGDWFEKPDPTVEDWVAASQRHQALAVEMKTDALRRRGDLVVSNAIHLMIDAWPAGWGKTLVDYSRQPKPAYFAYQNALEPVRIDLRTDRFTCYHDAAPTIEVWQLNDRPQSFENHRIEACVRIDGKVHASYALDPVTIEASGVDGAGRLPLDLPAVDERTTVSVEARLRDSDGTTVHDDRIELECFPRPSSATVTCLDEGAREILSPLPLQRESYKPGEPFETLVTTDPSAFDAHESAILERVARGARVVLLGGPTSVEAWTVAGQTVQPKPVDAQWFTEGPGLSFLARNEDHPLTAAFRAEDFKFVYNEETDRIDFLTTRYVDAEDLTPLLFTYDKELSEDIMDLGTGAGDKDRRPVVGQLEHGDGDIVFSELLLEERLGQNPVLDRFHQTLFEG